MCALVYLVSFCNTDAYTITRFIRLSVKVVGLGIWGSHVTRNLVPVVPF